MTRRCPPSVRSGVGAACACVCAKRCELLGLLMKSNVSTASFSACWLGMRRMPARGVAGTRGPSLRSLWYFFGPNPRSVGGACIVLDLRRLPTSNSGVEAGPGPVVGFVTEMRSAAALMAGLVPVRQYATLVSKTDSQWGVEPNTHKQEWFVTAASLRDLTCPRVFAGGRQPRATQRPGAGRLVQSWESRAASGLPRAHRATASPTRSGP
jgi:hypothetical protein